MEQLIVLGTGNAQATKCYNTCFALRKEQQYFLVDAGGGNGILAALDKADIKMHQIHDIFVTHEHCDHILGIIWMIRMIATGMKNNSYEGTCNIYAHRDLLSKIEIITEMTVQKKFYKMVGERIFLVPIKDGEHKSIMGYDIAFFDIKSEKAKQFGFTTVLDNGKKLTFAGDEPYNARANDEQIRGSDWLLHEAFCLYSEAAMYKPYGKQHATVKEACELAEEMGIPNLVLWHTEDANYERRKELYSEEGKRYYHGNLFVPYDLETIDL